MKTKESCHITLSSQIIEKIVINYLEEKLGKDIEAVQWVPNDDYGFAGLRIFINPEI